MGKYIDALKNLCKKVNGSEPTGKHTVEILKSFGYDLTGSQISSNHLADVLNEIADKFEPALALSVKAFNGSDDLLGKHASDLQENVLVNGGVISGTLHYVDDYTGFSGDAEEQKGNYLVLKANANLDNAVITAQVIGGTHPAVTLDDDGLCVFRLTSNEQSIRYTVAKDGITRTYNYSLDLEFESKED